MTFNISGNSNPTSVLDAMIETMILMAMADGTFQEAELIKLIFLTVEFLKKHPEFGHINAEQFQEKYGEIKRLVSQYGTQERVKVVARALPSFELRALAVYFAISISNADKHTDMSEHLFLNTLQHAFGLSREEMQGILDAYNTLPKS